MFGSFSTPVENFIANIGTVKSVKHQTINTNIFCKMRIEIQNFDPDNEIGISEQEIREGEQFLDQDH